MTAPRKRSGPKRSDAGMLRDAQLTDAQAAVLGMLGDAYRADVAVAIGTKTVWDPAADRAVARRGVAHGVVMKGYARYSEPNSKFLLLTTRGKAVVLS